MKYWQLLALGLFWAGVSIVFNPFEMALHVDEARFIHTSELFSKSWIPSVETLRNYPELNTPLIFIIWGWGVKIFGSHLWVGRIFNLCLGFLITLLFLSYKNTPKTPFLKTLLGVLCFPYFLFCAIYMYTDMMAVFLLLLAVIFYLRKSHLWAGILFSLAVFTRQYLIIFAAALVIYEIIQNYIKYPNVVLGTKQLWKNRGFYWPYLLPVLTLVAWIAFLGAPAPKAEMATQNYSTNVLGSYNIINMLYGIASAGAFCVVLEAVFFSDTIKSNFKITPLNLTALSIYTVLFVVYAPLKQHYVYIYGTDFVIQNMGALHFGMRKITALFGSYATFFEQTGYWILGALCCIRMFKKIDLLAVFALFHFILLTKTFWAWDKYNLPLVLLFWLYVRSREYFPAALEASGFYRKLVKPIF
jgi:DIE2/ALG10 family